MILLCKTLVCLYILSFVLLQPVSVVQSQVVAPASSQQSKETTDDPADNSHENFGKPEVPSAEDAFSQHQKGPSAPSRMQNDNGFGAIKGNSGGFRKPKNRPENRPFTDVSERDSQEHGLRKKREANVEDVQGFYNLTRISQQALGDLQSVLNRTQRWQLKRILSNSSLSKNQREQQADAWASRQGEAIQEAYERYKQTLEAVLTEMRAMHAQIARNLSAEAGVVDAELLAIYANNDLNMKQQCQKAAAVLANTTEQVRYELEGTFGHIPSSLHGHRGGHQRRGFGRRFGGSSQGQQQFRPDPFAQGGSGNQFNYHFNGRGRGARQNGGVHSNNLRGFGREDDFGGDLPGAFGNFHGFSGQAGYERRHQVNKFGNGQDGWAEQGLGQSI